MGEQNRLRGLEVGFARHHGLRVGVRLADQCVHHVQHAVRDRSDRIPQPHPEQRGHLVISRPSGAQAATNLGPNTLDQTALECTVHVLVGLGGYERTGVDVRREPVEPVEHRVEVGPGEQARTMKHARVRLRRPDVVRRQLPVKVG